MMPTDRLGYAVCPLMVTDYAWPDDDSLATEQLPLPPRRCGTTLHLVWLFDIPLSPGDACRAGEAHFLRVTDGWEVVCEGGHKLATSAGEENAEMFEFALALPLAESAGPLVGEHTEESE